MAIGLVVRGASMAGRAGAGAMDSGAAKASQELKKVMGDLKGKGFDVSKNQLKEWMSGGRDIKELLGKADIKELLGDKNPLSYKSSNGSFDVTKGTSYGDRSKLSPDKDMDKILEDRNKLLKDGDELLKDGLNKVDKFLEDGNKLLEDYNVDKDELKFARNADKLVKEAYKDIDQYVKDVDKYKKDTEEFIKENYHGGDEFLKRNGKGEFDLLKDDKDIEGIENKIDKEEDLSRKEDPDANDFSTERESFLEKAKGAIKTVKEVVKIFGEDSEALEQLDATADIADIGADNKRIHTALNNARKSTPHSNASTPTGSGPNGSGGNISEGGKTPGSIRGSQPSNPRMAYDVDRGEVVNMDAHVKPLDVQRANAKEYYRNVETEVNREINPEDKIRETDSDVKLERNVRKGISEAIEDIEDIEDLFNKEERKSEKTTNADKDENNEKDINELKRDEDREGTWEKSVNKEIDKSIDDIKKLQDDIKKLQDKSEYNDEKFRSKVNEFMENKREKVSNLIERGKLEKSEGSKLENQEDNELENQEDNKLDKDGNKTTKNKSLMKKLEEIYDFLDKYVDPVNQQLKQIDPGEVLMQMLKKYIPEEIPIEDNKQQQQQQQGNGSAKELAKGAKSLGKLGKKRTASEAGLGHKTGGKRLKGAGGETHNAKLGSEGLKPGHKISGPLDSKAGVHPEKVIAETEKRDFLKDREQLLENGRNKVKELKERRNELLKKYKDKSPKEFEMDEFQKKKNEFLKETHEEIKKFQDERDKLLKDADEHKKDDKFLKETHEEADKILKDAHEEMGKFKNEEKGFLNEKVKGEKGKWRKLYDFLNNYVDPVNQQLKQIDPGEAIMQMLEKYIHVSVPDEGSGQQQGNNGNMNMGDLWDEAQKLKNDKTKSSGASHEHPTNSKTLHSAGNKAHVEVPSNGVHKPELKTSAPASHNTGIHLEKNKAKVEEPERRGMKRERDEEVFEVDGPMNKKMREEGSREISEHEEAKVAIQRQKNKVELEQHEEVEAAIQQQGTDVKVDVLEEKRAQEIAEQSEQVEQEKQNREIEAADFEQLEVTLKKDRAVETVEGPGNEARERQQSGLFQREEDSLKQEKEFFSASHGQWDQGHNLVSNENFSPSHDRAPVSKQDEVLPTEREDEIPGTPASEQKLTTFSNHSTTSIDSGYWSEEALSHKVAPRNALHKDELHKDASQTHSEVSQTLGQPSSFDQESIIVKAEAGGNEAAVEAKTPEANAASKVGDRVQAQLNDSEKMLATEAIRINVENAENAERKIDDRDPGKKDILEEKREKHKKIQNKAENWLEEEGVMAQKEKKGIKKQKWQKEKKELGKKGKEDSGERQSQQILEESPLSPRSILEDNPVTEVAATVLGVPDATATHIPNEVKDQSNDNLPTGLEHLQRFQLHEEQQRLVKDALEPDDHRTEEDKTTNSLHEIALEEKIPSTDNSSEISPRDIPQTPQEKEQTKKELDPLDNKVLEAIQVENASDAASLQLDTSRSARKMSQREDRDIQSTKEKEKATLQKAASQETKKRNVGTAVMRGGDKGSAAAGMRDGEVARMRDVDNVRDRDEALRQPNEWNQQTSAEQLKSQMLRQESQIEEPKTVREVPIRVPATAINISERMREAEKPKLEEAKSEKDGFVNTFESLGTTPFQKKRARELAEQTYELANNPNEIKESLEYIKDNKEKLAKWLHKEEFVTFVKNMARTEKDRLSYKEAGTHIYDSLREQGVTKEDVIKNIMPLMEKDKENISALIDQNRGNINEYNVKDAVVTWLAGQSRQGISGVEGIPEPSSEGVNRLQQETQMSRAIGVQGS